MGKTFKKRAPKKLLKKRNNVRGKGKGSVRGKGGDSTPGTQDLANEIEAAVHLQRRWSMFTDRYPSLYILLYIP